MPRSTRSRLSSEPPSPLPYTTSLSLWLALSLSLASLSLAPCLSPVSCLLSVSSVLRRPAVSHRFHRRCSFLRFSTHPTTRVADPVSVSVTVIVGLCLCPCTCESVCCFFRAVPTVVVCVAPQPLGVSTHPNLAAPHVQVVPPPLSLSLSSSLLRGCLVSAGRPLRRRRLRSRIIHSYCGCLSPFPAHVTVIQRDWPGSMCVRVGVFLLSHRRSFVLGLVSSRCLVVCHSSLVIRSRGAGAGDVACSPPRLSAASSPRLVISISISS